MKKQILVLALAMLLVGSLVIAGETLKGGQEVTKVAWDTKGLSIKDDGVYRDADKIVNKELAEIWIDKKVEVTKEEYLGQYKIDGVYHVDSLVPEDTKVTLYLYYEIQPDVIYYKSENGKYQGYSTWTWEDKTDCGVEEYCGGYAVVTETLEYALGSNTFTSAISGATWQNDGIDITLAATTDYVVVGDKFQIVNQVYDKSYVSVAYSWENDSNAGWILSQSNKEISNNTSIVGIILTVVLIGLVITVLVGVFMGIRKPSV